MAKCEKKANELPKTTTEKKCACTSKRKTNKIPEIKVSKKQKIIFLGSEAAPFIATGGLADVLGSLPKALAKNKNLDISVILPLYSNINEEFKANISASSLSSFDSKYWDTSSGIPVWKTLPTK